MLLVTLKAILPCDHPIGFAQPRDRHQLVYIEDVAVLTRDGVTKVPVEGCISNTQFISCKATTDKFNRGGISELLLIESDPLCLDSLIGGTDTPSVPNPHFRVRDPAQTFVFEE